MNLQVDSNGTCTLLALTSVSTYMTPSEEQGANWLVNQYFYDDSYATYTIFKNELKRVVKRFDESQRNIQPFCVRHRAIIMCTTTHKQIISEKFLQRFGFQRCMGPVTKVKHPEYKLSLWAITTGDFLKNLDEDK